MLSDPIGERFFGDAPIGQCENFGNDFGIGRHKIAVIQT
jgi:hypothetical protein